MATSQELITLHQQAFKRVVEAQASLVLIYFGQGDNKSVNEHLSRMASFWSGVEHALNLTGTPIEKSPVALLYRLYKELHYTWCAPSDGGKNDAPPKKWTQKEVANMKMAAEELRAEATGN